MSNKKWDPEFLVQAAKTANVPYEVDKGWLDIDPYPTTFAPVGVIWHHTATSTLSRGDMPSLNWCRNPGQYAGKARACHILIGRSGKLQIIAGKGAYHAGEGGPLTVHKKDIPKDQGNRFLLGIEIEASSSAKINAKNRITPKSGLNPIQFENTARFCAALFDLLGWSTESAIRHRDWAPNRKIDVQIPLNLLRTEIDKYRKVQTEKPKPQKPTVVKLLELKPNKKNNSIRIVQEALKKEFPYANIPLTGFFNSNTQLTYKKWQEKLGYKGDDADGIPGKASLQKLAKKYGFEVK